MQIILHLPRRFSDRKEGAGIKVVYSLLIGVLGLVIYSEIFNSLRLTGVARNV